MIYKWKNQDLKDYGIIVEKIPAITKAKKKIDIIQVEGRNGFLSIDTNTYEPFSVTLECHCNTDVADLDAIKEFLDGYGTLSFDGIRQYTAVIDNTIPFETILPIFKKFQINFLVNPIAEDITPTVEDITNVELLSIETYAPTFPILEITCSGDVSVTINNETFYLYNTNGTYTLDCKNKIIIDSNELNASGIMNGQFPVFKNGTNTIATSGTITLLKATYNKSYL